VDPTSGSSYSWTVPFGAIITSGSTGPDNNSISVDFGSTDGDITVVETNAAGCPGIAGTLTVTLIGCGLDANFSASPVTICQGQTVTFTDESTGTTGTTNYNWNFGDGTSPATANSIGPHVVTYNTTGLKTVTLTITDGTSNTETKTGYISVNDLPTPSLVSSDIDNTFCAGTYVTFTGGGGASYNFRVNGRSVQEGPSNTYTTTSLTNNQVVDVIVTSAEGCSVTSSGISNAVIALPATSAITGTTELACFATGKTYSVVHTAGSTYAWTVPPDATIISGATGPDNNQITVNFGSTNGDITVAETNASNCSGTTRTLNITLAGCGLDANFSGAPLAICLGKTVTFTNLSTGTTGSTNYNWNFGDGASPANANTIGPYVVTYNTTGLKTITLIITEGATDAEIKTDYIEVIPMVTIAAFSPVASERCQGADTMTYTTSAANATGIRYTLDAASLAGGNTIDEATGIVTYAAPWSGTTTITASATGCNGPASTTHTVTVQKLLVPSFETIGPLPLFFPPPPLPAISNNNITGTWFPATIDTDTPGTTTHIFTPNEGQCATTAYLVVTVRNLPCPDIHLGSDIVACSLNPITLRGDDGSGESYLWSRMEGSVAVPIGTADSVQADRTADYILAVTKNDCTISDTVNVRLLDPLQFGFDSVNIKDNTCFGADEGSIEVFVHGTGSSYQYSINGGGNYLPDSLFENLQSGSYTIVVSEDSTCFYDYPSTVTIGPPDSIHITYHLMPPGCASCSDGKLTLEISGGWGDYKITLSGRPVELVTETMGLGTYTIEVTDAGNCKKTLELIVDKYNFIPNVITPNGDGLNDLWTIPMMEYFPDAIIKVFDVSGKLVFESAKGYPVPWDGKDKGTPLPMGTYYYLINLDPGEKPLTGYLTILR
ncbi:MAG: gliding motility-associated C-terminal domain-containing protein, partial [Bacteroidia bacterium]|nr:gliding motility-associated C-terminal domain-containing protein [Bacteroidia bacterium]